MALLRKIRIFGVGREVWTPVYKSGVWVPTKGHVYKVTKGAIHIRYDVDKKVSYSPNSRLVSLTAGECSSICEMINDSEEDVQILDRV